LKCTTQGFLYSILKISPGWNPKIILYFTLFFAITLAPRQAELSRHVFFIWGKIPNPPKQPISPTPKNQSRNLLTQLAPHQSIFFLLAW